MQRRFQDRSFWTSHDRLRDGIIAVLTRIFITRRVPAIVFPASREFTVKTEMRYQTTAIGNFRGRLDFAITAALTDEDVVAPELDQPSNIILLGEVKPSELDDNGAIVLGDVSEVDQQIRSRAAAATANGIHHPLILLALVGPFFKLYYWSLNTIRPSNSDDYYNSQEMTVVSSEGFMDLRSQLGQQRLQRVLHALAVGELFGDDELNDLFGDVGEGADQSTYLSPRETVSDSRGSTVSTGGSMYA